MSTLMRNLKTAIFFGDVKKVKKLLKSLAPIPLSKNPLIFGGYSLLKLAIKLRNRKEIAKLLIKKGARVNKKYCDESVPLLHIAIRKQHPDIVKLLVKKEANKWSRCISNDKFITEEIEKYSYCTALDLSCIYQQLKMARLFLKLNDKPNSTPLFDSNSISIAVIRNLWKVVRLLLKYNAWANSTISKMTITHCSRYYSRVPQTRLNSLGENPTLLHAAIVKNNVKMVELLINHGANIHYRTKSFKRTPLI
ncbi:Similar to ASB7: Ankyrin repeat and SOCS box protein 7 (Pongo abelii) [Cotesia congregata]|uniref:Similar to ASB7: Ankyrin repeat and SOCS box protein 7 (Pongo abelii) n=1 Tax=Cotesia congregata TaxID=51543 RepID=A0A8J2MNN2_COTCN|nr:Similar to ASB7: Ankyrin repeat and SOCS box protein 7 (Pongo abelii) [Cotesia congregata]